MDRDDRATRTAARHPVAAGSIAGLVVVGGFAIACVSEQPAGDAPSEARIDASAAAAADLVAGWVAEERIPGAVLLVSRGGQVVLERAFGFARLYEYDRGQYDAWRVAGPRPDALRRLPEPVPLDATTAFDLASVTKVMATTLAVMLLVDDGAIELDAPVQRYLTDFRERGPDSEPGATSGAGAAAGGRESITVRQLLTHRSGLSQWQPIYYHADEREGAYAFIRDFPLGWPVGEGQHYSDLGFMLLGRIVEQVSGQSLGTFLDERLYGPLGLTSTGFRSRSSIAAALAGSSPGRFASTSHGNPFEHRMVHDPDFGYRIDIDPANWDGWREYTLAGEVNDGNAFHAFGGEAGHAGLFSTAGELHVLLRLLLNGGEYGGRRYLSAEVVTEFLTDQGDGQALGWQAPEFLPAGSFAHPGFTGTWVAGIPARDTAVVLLTNRQNLGVDEAGQYPNLNELQREVAVAVLRAAGDPAPPEPAAVDPDAAGNDGPGSDAF